MPRRFAGQLSDKYDYAIVWWGQSVSRPWGLTAEAFLQMPELDRSNKSGKDITFAYIEAVSAGVSKAMTTTELTLSEWTGAQVRLGLPGNPIVGYGTVHEQTGGSVAAGSILSFARAASVSTSQILMTRVETSTATAGTGPHITVSGTPWASLVNQFAGLTITHGTSTGVVASNTANTITLASGWTGGTPTPGTFTIGTASLTANALVGQALLLDFSGTKKLAVVTANTTSSISYATVGSVTGTDLTFAVGCLVNIEWFNSAGTPLSALNTTSAYFTRDEGQFFRSYENVSILTPYQPETYPAAPGVMPYPTGTPAAPGFTTTATKYEDLGFFLPFTFLEGLWGSGATGTATSVNATSLTATGFTTNTLVGGWVRCGNSVGRIASNTTTTITLTSAGWIGGTPAAGAFVAWLGHYKDNPHAVSPGEGFTYPNNDMMPSGLATSTQASKGVIHNRPRGEAALGGGGTANDAFMSSSYGDRTGQILPCGYRMSLELGHRLSFIHLGINSAGQIPRNVQNRFGYPGQIGWWDYNKHLDWTPSNPDGLAARLRKLIEVIAPAAQASRANGKTLKILAIVGDQGQADALSPEGRATFKHSMPRFYAWLRKVIQDAGLSFYPTAEQIPVLHAKIAHTPYEFNGVVANYPNFTFSGDSGGLVNSAIDEFVLRDGYATTHEIDDSLNYKYSDILHFNGYGEVVHGLRKADALLDLLDSTLSLTGNDAKIQTAVVEICNAALAHIGDAAQITAVSPPDGSPQASHCSRYYALARDTVLAMRPWTFARRRVALTAVTNTRTEWDYAYAVPVDVMTPTAVTASDATDDYLAGNQFIAPPPSPQVQPRVQMEPTAYVPQSYVLERDATGYPVIYTDQQAASLRYQARVTDATAFPPLFKLAVSYQLASMLAGALVKGDQGREVAERFLKLAQLTVAQAAELDATQQRTPVKPVTSWIANRR